jgi:phenylpropionate dioxygenase-like ring-hydroxylating dioxygenase large terminal subunit
MAALKPLSQSLEQPLTRPMHRFGKERYISEQWLEDEWHGIWQRCWQVAVPLSDVAVPGDFATYEIGRESILITRDKHSQLRAFYNVCQHRGVRLVAEECGHQDSFRCPYHSWRYNPEGELTRAPAPTGFQDGLPTEQVRLKEVRCDQALGLVWICLDCAAEPLAEFLAALSPLMEHYRFEEMTLVEDQSVSINCNWKAVLDNFGELYHVPHLHPQHRSFVDCTQAVNDLYPGGHTRVIVAGGTTDSLFAQPEEPPELLKMQLEALGLVWEDYKGNIDAIRPAIQAAKRKLGESSLPFYSNFTDAELTDVAQTNVFPNMVCTYQPEMMWLMRVRPHPTDPNQCYFDKISFEMVPEQVTDIGSAAGISRHHHDKPAMRPQRDSFSYRDVLAGHKTMTDTIDQDLSLLSQAQQGMHSEGFGTLWLNEAECRVAHFHECLDALLQQHREGRKK